MYYLKLNISSSCYLKQILFSFLFGQTLQRAPKEFNFKWLFNVMGVRGLKYIIKKIWQITWNYSYQIIRDIWRNIRISEQSARSRIKQNRCHITSTLNFVYICFSYVLSQNIYCKHITFVCVFFLAFFLQKAASVKSSTSLNAISIYIQE